MQVHDLNQGKEKKKRKFPKPLLLGTEFHESNNSSSPDAGIFF
jgi:hypothetical protein